MVKSLYLSDVDACASAHGTVSPPSSFLPSVKSQCSFHFPTRFFDEKYDICFKTSRCTWLKTSTGCKEEGDQLAPLLKMRKGRSKIFLLLAAVTASHLHNADAHSVKAKVASHSMLQMEERVERDQPRNNFIQVKNESEQDFASARQEALEDLQAAFSMAPQEVTLNLGNSSKFSKAFKQYSETGVCNAWMDLKTGKVRHVYY